MRSFLVLVMLFITVTMSAQVTTATMSGKVTAQDEPIIGATIVAVHEPSGTRYGTVTNVSGQFNLQGMRTGGPYKVEISYVGYQTAIYKGINLSLGENYVLNVSLKDRHVREGISPEKSGCHHDGEGLQPAGSADAAVSGIRPELF